jgi:hypothetical protein
LKRIANYIALAEYACPAASLRPAEAHAIFVSASPKAGSAVTGLGVVIGLHFISCLERLLLLTYREI